MGIFYTPKINTAKLKYTKTEQVSTIVVINGEAIIAGSNFNFLASIGKIQPKDLASIATIIRVSPTTTASLVCPISYCINILIAFISANVVPTNIATLTSFHHTLKKSFNFIFVSVNIKISKNI